MSDAVERLKALFRFRVAAETTLTDPGIVQGFADLRQAAHESFAASAPNQSETRETAYFMLRALDGLEAALANRVAAHEMQQQMDEKAEALTSGGASTRRRDN